MQALPEQQAGAIAEALGAAVAERGSAVLAVSGGRSVAALFEALSALELPWQSVTIVQVDERWVPSADPASNALLVRQHLLKGPAAVANFIALDTDAAGSLEAAVDRYEIALRALPQPFDVLLLGMGEDGHTASIFPQADNLAALIEVPSARLCHATRPSGIAQARMTLGLATLLAARQIQLSFAGAEKAARYQQALALPTPSLPISLLLKHRKLQVWAAP